MTEQDMITVIMVLIAALLGALAAYALVSLLARKKNRVLQDALVSVQTRADQLENQLNTISDERNALSDELKPLTVSIGALKASSDALLSRKAELEIELSTEKDKHTVVREERDSARQGLSTAQAALEAAQQAKTEAEHQTHQQQQALRQDIAELRKDNHDLQQENKTLLASNTELKTAQSERDANHKEKIEQFEQQKRDLKVEFQNLANQIFEEKGKTFSQTSQLSMDAMLKPFKEQIEAFQKRINDVHDKSMAGNATLKTEIKKVLEVGLKMSGDAHNLTTALKGEKKTAGNWGEVQLERTLQLAGLLRGAHYGQEENFKDLEGKNKRPDFVVKLPDDKHMIIDSKVSLVDYDQAIAADTEPQVQLALDAHAKAVRNHIDGLAAKDYTNLIGIHSPSFVLMFMPIEPAYIEALKHHKDLFNYGYDKGVIMVSHTTLMPILRTVANLWMIERGNTEAREISEKAGDIYNQVCMVADRLQRLGVTLGTASKHYNSAVTALVGQQGLHGKVDRFSQLSNKVSKSMPVLEPLHADFESERLELLVEVAPEFGEQGEESCVEVESGGQ